jgi:hypothetical protein
MGRSLPVGGRLHEGRRHAAAGAANESHLPVRRALTKGQQVPPKSGKGRVAPSLANALFDLLAQRRVEAMQRAVEGASPRGHARGAV